MTQLNRSEYILVTDHASLYPGLRFTDWCEVGSNQTVHSGGCVSFTLLEPLKAGQFVICGRRGQVQKLAAGIDRNMR